MSTNTFARHGLLPFLCPVNATHPYTVSDMIHPSEYPELIRVWESSVKATHHFLAEADFLFYKSVISGYFEAVRLFCIRNEAGGILGFLGCSGEAIEMLFVDATLRGKGVGKTLLHYAVDELGLKKVDVNEQNTQAVGFYERFGFRTQSRSETDGTGRPYPVLHLVYPD